ncbi:MAG TPA: phosphocholine cytidylyltransferase family protein [Pseudonocardiaceae bacterium]|jgi:choline kinase
MKGIILAAGRGSRLRGLTDDRPKCLVELAGHPLLSWQRAALSAGGVTEVAIVAGYRADSLLLPGLPMFVAPRWADTNMVMSLATAAPWLRERPCVVSYGDIVFSPATVRALIDTPGDLAISYDPRWYDLWDRRFTEPLDDAETFRRAPDGSLAEIGRRAGSATEIEGQYMGLLRFTPAAWAAVEELLAGLPASRRDRLDMTGLLQLLVETGNRVDTVACAGPWGEVDHENDLDVCESLVAAGALRFAGGES